MPEIAHVNSKYQQLSLTKYEDQYSLLSNYKYTASFPDKQKNRLLASFYLSQNPDIKKILIIGSGSEGMISELARYDIDDITYLLVDPKEHYLIKQYLDKEQREIFKSKKVKTYFSDPIVWLSNEEKITSSPFDLIIISLPDPSNSFINRYYTREFYIKLKKMLSNNGILTTSVISSENYINRVFSSYLSSIVFTLKDVFPNVILFPGEKLILFASEEKDAITEEYKKLVTNYNLLNKVSFFDPSAFSVFFSETRKSKLNNTLSSVKPEINTIGKPISYYHSLILWSDMASSKIKAFFISIRKKSIILPLLFLFSIWIYLFVKGQVYKSNEKRIASYALLTVFITGLSAISVQICTLYSYQNILGFLYRDIALLSSVFMMGLAIGSITATKIKSKQVSFLIAAEILFILICSAFIQVYSKISGIGGISAAIFLFFISLSSGFTTGFVFPLGIFLIKNYTDKIDYSVSRANSLDHLGAASGAFITGAVLFPLLGLTVTLTLLLTINFLTLILLITCKMDFIKSDLKHKPELSYLKLFLLIMIFLLLFFLLKPVAEKDIQLKKPVLKEAPKAAFNKKIESIKTNKILTKYFANDIDGYGGPIELEIEYENSGNIRNIRVLKHNETDEYIQDLDIFLKRFHGFNLLNDRFSSDNIDAMTSATITSDSIINIIVRTQEKLTGKTTEKKRTAKKEDPDPLPLVNRPPPAVIRDLNKDMIDRLIKEGKISDKESMYYRIKK